jgi:hypothetical protein
MKKIALLLLLMLPVVTPLPAQEAKELFIPMPDSLMPLLTPVNRADFVDFLDSNMRAQVKNAFGNISEMTDLSPDYIRLQLTSHNTWQMKVLAVDSTTKVICTVATACAPVCDSYIRFFTTDWKPLPVRTYLPLPPKADDSYPMRRGDLSKTGHTLAFTLASFDDRDEAKTVVYEWRAGKFQLAKE